MKKVTNVWSEPVPVPIASGRNKGYSQLAPGESLDLLDGEFVEKETRRLEKKGRLKIEDVPEPVEDVKKVDEPTVNETVEDIQELEQKLLADDPGEGSDE